MLGKNISSQSVDFIFTSVLKVAFHFYTICFYFLLVFIIIKLQPETRGGKNPTFKQGFSWFLISLKAAAIFRVAKMRKNCPFILTESPFQGISIF